MPAYLESGYLRNKNESKRTETRNINKTLTPVVNRDERFIKEAASHSIHPNNLEVEEKLNANSIVRPHFAVELEDIVYDKPIVPSCGS